MEIIDFILHIGDKLDMLFAQYGTLLYWILFLIVFAETGFVVTPFLPGDSLLFAAGMLAANSDGVLSPYLIILVCIVVYDMKSVDDGKADSIKYLFSSIQNAPIVFFTNNFPSYYSDFVKMLIVFLRLFMFALFTSILFKRMIFTKSMEPKQS